jgi:hypothetical protein
MKLRYVKCVNIPVANATHSSMIITVTVPPRVSSKTLGKREWSLPVESPVQQKMYVEIHGIT